jgi:hypothetical protein
MTRPRIARLQRRWHDALDPYRGLEAERRPSSSGARAAYPARRRPIVIARGIDALQNTDGRPSDDFEGAVE